MVLQVALKLLVIARDTELVMDKLNRLSPHAQMALPQTIQEHYTYNKLHLNRHGKS